MKIRKRAIDFCDFCFKMAWILEITSMLFGGIFLNPFLITVDVLIDIIGLVLIDLVITKLYEKDFGVWCFLIMMANIESFCVGIIIHAIICLG